MDFDWFNYFLNDVENEIYRIEDYVLAIVGGAIGGRISGMKFKLKSLLDRFRLKK